MSEMGLSPTQLWELLGRRQGYGSYDDVVDDLEERFTVEQTQQFREEMARAAEADRRRMVSHPGVNHLAEPALLAVPEALFLDALEIGFEKHGSYAGGLPQAAEINQLFERRGIYFRIDSWGRVEWIGDPGAWETVTAPALAALEDERLGGARDEFEAARIHLRRGSSKDLEDAIEEAGKAVESAMKVLLDSHGIARSGRETATPLFNMLRESSIVEAETDQLILGVARIRNQWGGHGSGAEPRVPPFSLVEFTVQGAAAAIVFLASRLP